MPSTHTLLPGWCAEREEDMNDNAAVYIHKLDKDIQ